MTSLTIKRPSKDAVPNAKPSEPGGGSPPNRTVFDVEFLHPLPLTPNGAPDWTRQEECGVCTIGIWRLLDIAPRVIMPQPPCKPVGSALFCMTSGVVTWNGLYCDVPVVRAELNNSQWAPKGKHVDLLALCILRRLGFNLATFADGVPPDWKRLDGVPRGGSKYRGLKLDDVGQTTLRESKRIKDGGAFAPDMWQEGRQDEVVSYCLQDVAITRLLYLYAWQHGFLIDKSGRKIQIPKRCL